MRLEWHKSDIFGLKDSQKAFDFHLKDFIIFQDEDGLTAVNLNILPRIWIPDVEILDLMSFETHKVLSKLEGSLFQNSKL